MLGSPVPATFIRLYQKEIKKENLFYLFVVCNSYQLSYDPYPTCLLVFFYFFPIYSLMYMFSKDGSTAIKEFIKITNMVNEGIIIDPDYYDLHQLDINESALSKKMTGILSKHGQCIEGLRTCRNESERNALIREIKASSVVSVRQLARRSGISKDIIFRAL